jgi:hypothetical protein
MKKNLDKIKLVSVSGCAHGGTTLMATILGANKDWHLITTETCAYTLDKWTNRSDLIKRLPENSQRVIEKTPRHVYNLNSIKKDFPQSSFVVMVRNPLDVVLSIYKRDGNFNNALYQHSSDLTACISVINKQDTVIVEYENIIEDFDLTVKNVCNHTGVEFTESMRNFHMYSPSWFEEFLQQGRNEHLLKRSVQMKTPLFDGRGRGILELSPKQARLVIQDCEDKYFMLTGKNIS